jgi:hypothetical protein
MRVPISISFSKFSATRRLARPPHSCQIIRGGRQQQLHRNFFQPATSELTHSSLLFQYSEHRFHDGLSPLINSSSRRVAQFLPHSPLRQVTGPQLQSASAIQPARQVRVRDIAIHLPFFQSAHSIQQKNPLSALTLCGFAPHCCSTRSTIGSSNSLSLFSWVTLCATII